MLRAGLFGGARVDRLKDASRLSLLGGKPIRSTPFPRYNSIADEEKEAARQVLDTGVLSDFYGSWSARFEGGPQVKALETEWAARFGSKHAVSLNTATSALYAAVGALGIGPGDEVIVSPYTMSASATAALVYGATPVFADVEPEFFCLSPKSVESRMTARTKAIIAVDIMGQPADFEALRTLTSPRGIPIIEDCAQAPGALFHGKPAGTLGDIGVYSLNCHKTIQCGEGGIAVTNDDALALRLKLIRNHAEAVVGGMPDPPPGSETLIGWNYRMTEIEAAIARVQLRRLDSLNRERIDRVRYLDGRLSAVPGLTPPSVRPGSSHVYYVHGIRLDPERLGVGRDLFVKALLAEGVAAGAGYVRPLYRLPAFSSRGAAQDRCPVVERLHFVEMVVNSLIYPPLERADLDDVARAYEKVAENAAALAAAAPGA